MAVIQLEAYRAPIEELELVRHRIEFLLEWRLLSPFTLAEQEEYDTLCEMERQLMGQP